MVLRLLLMLLANSGSGNNRCVALIVNQGAEFIEDPILAEDV